MLYRIDIRKIRHDIASASVEARALKRALRRTWVRPMADEQRRLARLARRVTELCVLLARSRGRYHVTAPPREARAAGASWSRDAWHARIVGRLLPDYAAGDGAGEGAVS